MEFFLFCIIFPALLLPFMLRSKGAHKDPGKQPGLSEEEILMGQYWYWHETNESDN